MHRGWMILIVLTLLVGACSGAQQQQTDPKATTDLRMSVQDFHKKMRWGLWEQAALYADDSYRPTFEGRFEEYGDDYRITDLTVKTVEFDGPRAEVDVEQSWYREPNMTLKKERYIEVWYVSGGTWRLNDRVERDEFRKRKKEALEEASEEAKDGDEADPDTDSPADETTPADEAEEDPGAEPVEDSAAEQ